MIRNATSDKHDEALKVFILNDNTEKEMNDSLKIFIDLFSIRQRSDREFWLLDLTQLAFRHERILNSLKDLKLDLDDDLYLYMFNHEANALEIFEYYEIHSTVDRQFLAYGSWTSENGLLVTDVEKWNRRRNLQVLVYLIDFFSL